jgi:rSAM/selenodomain-associated transferase 1
MDAPRPTAVRDSACLLVFTKPAVAGRVKTRLVGGSSGLSAGQAAELHAAFLDDLLTRLEPGARWHLALAWALEEGEAIPETAHAAIRQRGVDLGERLYLALAAAAEEHELVAAVGSDHPDLQRERVEEAFRALAAGAGVVLGPASDGGYYLVGARRETLSPRLFADIAWSGPTVFAQTLERCRELGVEPHLLPPGDDVDTPSDLERLAATLAHDPASCPRTARLLAGWGMMPVVSAAAAVAGPTP